MAPETATIIIYDALDDNSVKVEHGLMNREFDLTKRGNHTEQLILELPRYNKNVDVIEYVAAESLSGGNFVRVDENGAEIPASTPITATADHFDFYNESTDAPVEVMDTYYINKSWFGGTTADKPTAAYIEIYDINDVESPVHTFYLDLDVIDDNPATVNAEKIEIRLPRFDSLGNVREYVAEEIMVKGNFVWVSETAYITAVGDHFDFINLAPGGEIPEDPEVPGTPETPVKPAPAGPVLPNTGSAANGVIPVLGSVVTLLGAVIIRKRR